MHYTSHDWSRLLTRRWLKTTEENTRRSTYLIIWWTSNRSTICYWAPRSRLAVHSMIIRCPRCIRERDASSLWAALQWARKHELRPRTFSSSPLSPIAGAVCSGSDETTWLWKSFKENQTHYEVPKRKFPLRDSGYAISYYLNNAESMPADISIGSRIQIDDISLSLIEQCFTHSPIDRLWNATTPSSSWEGPQVSPLLEL